MARINGIEEATDGMTLSELLEKKGYSKRFIAVECNGQTEPKTLDDSYEIQREDQIEIVQFVGGG